MAIQITCHRCGKSFDVKDGFAGRMGKCPDCTALIQVPFVQTAAVPSQSKKTNAPQIPAAPPQNAPAQTMREVARTAMPAAQQTVQNEEPNPFAGATQVRYQQPAPNRWAVPLVVGIFCFAAGIVIGIVAAPQKERGDEQTDESWQAKLKVAEYRLSAETNRADGAEKKLASLEAKQLAAKKDSKPVVKEPKKDDPASIQAALEQSDKKYLESVKPELLLLSEYDHNEVLRLYKVLWDNPKAELNTLTDECLWKHRRLFAPNMVIKRRIEFIGENFSKNHDFRRLNLSDSDLASLKFTIGEVIFNQGKNQFGFQIEFRQTVDKALRDRNLGDLPEQVKAPFRPLLPYFKDYIK